LHGRFELGVVEPIELEREEQEVRRGSGDAFLHVGVEFCARGIDGVAGVEKPGIGRDAAEQIIQRLVALHRVGERRAGLGTLGERRELALVLPLESEAFGSAALEIAFHLRIIEPGVEIGEIPFRQRAETRSGRRFGRSVSGGAFGLCGHNWLRRETISRPSSGLEQAHRTPWIWRDIAAGSTWPLTRGGMRNVNCR